MNSSCDFSAQTVEILCPYRFHADALGGQLAQRGLLRQFHTALPKRAIPDLNSGDINSRPYLAALRYVGRRTWPSADRKLARLVIRDFDRHVSRELSRDSTLWAFSSFGLESHRTARELGARSIVDRSSWHIEEQAERIRRECEGSGLRGPDIDSWIVERELEEYGLADVIVVPSEGAKLSFERRGFEAAKIETIPLGVDVEDFPFGPWAERTQGRVLFVGQLSVQKAPHHLLQAAGMTESVRKLVFVGPFDPSVVRKMGIHEDDSVVLMGRQPRRVVAREMRRAHVFVIPSIHDGFGAVAVQAMASGAPVIASENAGASELISDHVDGWTFPAGDSEALASRLERALTESCTESISRAGSELARSGNGWQSYGTRVEEVVNRLA